MKLVQMICPYCGGKLEYNNGEYKCSYCDAIYKESSKDDLEKVLNYLNNQKQELLANARRLLWDATHEEYISSEKVKNASNEVLKLYQDDFYANFYLASVSPNRNDFNNFINNIDINKYRDYIPSVLDYCVKSLDYSNVIPLKNLIDKALPINLKVKYNSLIEDEANKLNEGIYNIDIPRDCFIAYSSRDMATVIEVCNYLESEGLSCFVALRNLRHGKGAIENYKEYIYKALRNCKVLVFISSENSRKLDCDALSLELPYFDENCNNKGRIEYLIESYNNTSKAAKILLNSIFDGLEYCTNLDDLLSRVVKLIAKRNIKEDKNNFKYCVGCLAENKLDAKFCSECGGNEFANTKDEAFKLFREKQVIIKKEDRLKYYEALDKAHTKNDYTDFIKLIIKSEKEMFNKYFEVL